MRVASVLAVDTLVFLSVISATEDQRDTTTPIPLSKLRTETNVAPPPGHQAAHGERQLGIFDWLVKSETVAPDAPAPAPARDFGFGNNNDCDDVFISCS
ncbi:hypothetical protein PR003_g1978 [Phytophthora rubi]|uniref:RxLR effector protein n=1 Tax=Phytophthora rubi TaxID=129364 RepID=A0A6A4FU22_9STRA|nr:hypothetical protein PR001_g1925 [Phytophthora rubi]KAE9357088.1 hypothetical protein PR003_g1978 [Phytophthora rubi]